MPDGLLALDMFAKIKTVFDEASFSSSATKVERAALESTQRTTRVVEQGATVQAAASNKVLVARDRLTVAEARYNKVLQSEAHDIAKLASAHAGLISAQDRLDRAQRQAAQSASHLSTNVRGISFGGAAGMLGASVAVYKLVGAFRNGEKAAETQQRVMAQTDAVLRSTGNTAGVTAVSVDKMSRSLARMSGVNDDAIGHAQNLLLTFTGIRNLAGPGNDIFDQATKATLNLAIAMGRANGQGADLQKTAIQIGKALNDPLQGMTALTRVGVSFTTQQKEQVKALAQSGRTLDAQRLILNELNKEFGGTAEAYGKTAEGAAGRARVAYDELSKSLAKGVLPAVTAVATGFADTFDFFQRHRNVEIAIGSVAGLAAATYGLYKVEQGIKALRESELLNIARRLFGYRSLAGAELSLAAAEDRHAEAAERVAVAEQSAAGATARSGATAAAATAEQGVYGEMAALRSTIPGASGPGRLALLARNPALYANLAGLGATVGGGVLLATGHQTSGSILTGAGTGAMLGSVVPGVGTALGAGVGATVGLLTQAYLRSDQGGQITAAAQKLASDPAALAAAQRRYAALRGRGGSPQQMARAAELAASINKAKAALADPQTAALLKALNPSAADISAADVSRQAAAYRGTFGQFDAVPSTTVDNSQLYAARDDAVTRRTDAVHRVELAEQRLAQLRSGRGKASAAQLASAEDALRRAKEASAKASRDANAAESKVAKAHTTTALSIQDLVKQSGQQRLHQRGLADASSRLIAEGFNAPVIAKLFDIEKSAPGTVERVASTATKAYVRRLNQDFALDNTYAQTIGKAMSAATQSAAKDAADVYVATFYPELARRFGSSPAEVRSPGVRRRDIRDDPRPAHAAPGTNYNFNFNAPTTVTDAVAVAQAKRRARLDALAG